MKIWGHYNYEKSSTNIIKTLSKMQLVGIITSKPKSNIH